MYKTILEQIEEVEQLIGHNEGAGYEHELERLKSSLAKMTKTAIWASPHYPTGEQIRSLEGRGFLIRFLSDIDPDLFKELSNLKLDSDRTRLAIRLLSLDCTAIIQPAGDPAFQCHLGAKMVLAHESRTKAPAVWYAFSRRVSMDVPQEDGSVKKVSTFQFEGWV